MQIESQMAPGLPSPVSTPTRTPSTVIQHNQLRSRCFAPHRKRIREAPMMLTWGRDRDKVYYWSEFLFVFQLLCVLTCCLQGPSTLTAVYMHLMSSPLRLSGWSLNYLNVLVPHKKRIQLLHTTSRYGWSRVEISTGRLPRHVSRSGTGAAVLVRFSVLSIDRRY